LDLLSGPPRTSSRLLPVPRGAAGRLCAGIAVQRLGPSLRSSHRLEQSCLVGRRETSSAGALTLKCRVGVQN
ncbi:hypothetical protein Cfor_00929, partial [Coptotermes formosanus]